MGRSKESSKRANAGEKKPQRRSRAASSKTPVPIPIREEEESQPPPPSEEAMELKDAPDAAAEPVEGPKRRGAKRKSAANNSSVSSSKRQAKEKPQFPLPTLHTGPLTRARHSPNLHAVAAPQSPSAPSPPAGEPIAGATEPIPACEERNVPEQVVDEEFEALRLRDANVHVVPTPAGWFSWTRIHLLEKRAVASFFNGKSEDRTPDIYIEIRNAIMKKFHMDPQTRIELNDLSGLSIGNSEARQEVMEFLDHWGLINFHPFPSLDSPRAAANGDKAAKRASLIDELYHFEEVLPCVRAHSGTDMYKQTMPTQLLPESAISDNLLVPDGPAVEYHCNSCSTDCSRKRYHCQTQADFDLCSECYNDGKFGSGMKPADFILMENAEAPGLNGGNWTDQETLLLLEALELYGENWSEIAEHVATKTKEQCILHFFQMPIEDSFLDGKESNDAGTSLENLDPVLTIKDSSAVDAVETSSKKSEANEEQHVFLQDAVSIDVLQATGDDFAINAVKAAFQAVGHMPRQGETLSFSEAGNQVMALAVFLSGLVKPDVAAALTRSSLRAMSENSPNVQLASRHCFFLEDPPTAMDPLVCQSSIDVGLEPQKEETQTTVLEDSEVLKGFMTQDNENMVPRENDVLLVSEECKKKSDIAESDGFVLVEVKPSAMNESVEALFQRKVIPHPVKESNELALWGDPMPTVRKESDVLASSKGDTKCSVLTKTVDVETDSVPSMGHEPVTGPSIGGNDTQLLNGKNEKKCDLLESRDDHNTDRIKRAALTALSAAAVKAKFLANQEEDEIQELVKLLIEKQLHKLESKLALFSEMETVILKVKEQLGRGKQRLFHERARIIAAQLNLQSSASRPMAPSLSTSQFALNYGN